MPAQLGGGGHGGLSGRSPYLKYAAQYDQDADHPDALYNEEPDPLFQGTGVHQPDYRGNPHLNVDSDGREGYFEEDDDLEPPQSLFLDGGAVGNTPAVLGRNGNPHSGPPQLMNRTTVTGLLQSNDTHAPQDNLVARGNVPPPARGDRGERLFRPSVAIGSGTPPTLAFPESPVEPRSTSRNMTHTHTTEAPVFAPQRARSAPAPAPNLQTSSSTGTGRQPSLFEYIFSKDSGLRTLLVGPRVPPGSRPRHPAPATNAPASARYSHHSPPSPRRYEAGTPGGARFHVSQPPIVSTDPDDDDTTPLLHSSSVPPSYYTQTHSTPVPLHLPPSTSSYTPGGRLPPRDAALNLWASIRTSAELDKFMQRLYAYYVGRGMWSVVLDRLVGVLTASFVVLFPTFLIRCIDFTLTPNPPNLPSVLVPNWADVLLNPFSSVPNFAFALWVTYEISRLLYDLPGLSRMRGFVTFALEVPEMDLWSVGWSFIVSRVCGEWLSPIRLVEPANSSSKPNHNGLPSERATSPQLARDPDFNTTDSDSDVPLHALTIANRILRKENYLVGLLGGTGVDPAAKTVGEDSDEDGVDVMTLGLRYAFADPALPFLPKVLFKWFFGAPPVVPARTPESLAPKAGKGPAPPPAPVYLFPLTRNLEWNFSFCVLAWMFDETGEIRKGVRLGPAPLVDQEGVARGFRSRVERLGDVGLGAGTRPGTRKAVVEGLQRRFRVMAVLNLLFAPFVFVFMVLYFFFENAEEYYKNPAALGTRTWTPLARWKFRTFNELPHYFTTRINRSHPLALAYLGDFPNWHNVILARFVAFVTGSFAAVLTIASLIDEDLLLRFEITKGHSAVFYIGVFAAVFAVARSMVPEEHIVFDPRSHLTRLAKFTYYLPKRWIGNFHSEAVRKEVEALFDAKISLWFREVCALASTPAILWYALGREDTVDAIVGFFERNAKWVEGVGWVCKYAWWEEETSVADGADGSPVGPEAFVTGEQDTDMDHTVGPSASPERQRQVRVLDFTSGPFEQQYPQQRTLDGDYLSPYDDRDYDRDRDGHVELDILPQDDKMMKSFMQFRQNHPGWDVGRPSGALGAGLSRSIMYLGQHLGPGGPSRHGNLSESFAPDFARRRRYLSQPLLTPRARSTMTHGDPHFMEAEGDGDGSGQFFTPPAIGSSYVSGSHGGASPYRSVADVSRWGSGAKVVSGAGERMRNGAERRDSVGVDPFQRIASPDAQIRTISSPPPTDRSSAVSPPPRILDFTATDGPSSRGGSRALSPTLPRPDSRADAMSPTGLRSGATSSSAGRSGATSPPAGRAGTVSPPGMRPEVVSPPGMRLGAVSPSGMRHGATSPPPSRSGAMSPSNGRPRLPGFGGPGATGAG
ncbi:autophagy protein atg9 [Gonapodya sp. JEL0774]|nr:autophagy protein atg9 [Gonapodya sp. JEL0774]